MGRQPHHLVQPDGFELLGELFGPEWTDRLQHLGQRAKRTQRPLSTGSPADLESTPSGGVRRLQRQPGFAYSGFPLHQHHPALPGQHPLQVANEAAPLLFSSDKGDTRSTTQQRRTFLPPQGSNRRTPLTENPPVQLNSGLRRLRLQLLSQHRPAPFELLDSVAGPPQQEAKPHHLPVGLFSERIVVGESSGMGQRLLEVTFGLGRLDQTAEGHQVALPVVILFDHHPVVEESGQEVASVQLHTSTQVGSVAGASEQGVTARDPQRIEKVIELLDIQPVRYSGVEGESVNGGRQIRRRTIAQRILYLPQGMTEAAPSPPLREIRPEGTGQRVARQGPVPMHHQVSEHRPSGTRRDRWQRLTIAFHQEATKQVHPQWLHHTHPGPQPIPTRNGPGLHGYSNGGTTRTPSDPAPVANATRNLSYPSNSAVNHPPIQIPNEIGRAK